MAVERGGILVVEDDDDVREVVVSFLAGMGHDVIAAASGEEAMAHLRQDRPIDLLFTDIVLGGLNGMRLARQAIMLRPSLKVLYATGYAEPVREKEPMLARGDVVNKPYRLARLEAQIAEVLRAPPYALNKVLRQLWIWWSARRGDRLMPALDEIDPAQLADIAADLAIAEVASPPPESRCRYVYFGATLVRTVGRDPVGLTVDELARGDYRAFITGLYRDVVTTGRGVYAASCFTGAENLLTERLFLPLGKDGAVEGVVAAQTFDRVDHSPTAFEIAQEASGRVDIVEPVAAVADAVPDEKTTGAAPGG